MNDLLTMERGERAEHRQGCLDRFSWRKRPPGEPDTQRLAVKELHREVEPVGILVNLVQLAHVRMADAGARPRLAPQALSFLPIAARAYALDGHRPAEAIVMRLIHDAHSTLSQLAHHPIAARRFQHAPFPVDTTLQFEVTAVSLLLASVAPRSARPNLLPGGRRRPARSGESDER